MARVEGTSALKHDGKYTLADWRSWPIDERWELIDGIAYCMSPAPRVPHQEKAYDLGRKLGNFLEGMPCRPFMAPLDVFLEEDAQGDGGIVVEPDVMVVCEQGKIADDGIHGAPDFVAEVLSDSTANKDFGVKKELYERSGVREYWIIHPDTGDIFQYVRDGALFAPVQEHRRGVPVHSSVFTGFSWACT
ncbi:MAG: Uma2 family endonuclease [Spirochaetae bacterium HGW-Spirochaetae-7]|jgi:Uma2 family endonuclease|nr:MAG: Uma2 family endonuclease [Spirochaetae bacterium HGW-Spirochaetae-7]